MSLAIAAQLARATGSTISRTAPIVRQRGAQWGSQAVSRARTLSGSRTVQAGSVLGGVGAGATYWREQDVRTAEALADQSESEQELATSLMDNDELTPEQKGDLLDNLLDDPDEENPGDDSVFQQIADAMKGDSLQGTAVRVAIAALIVYAAIQVLQGQSVNVPQVTPGGAQ